MFSTSPNFKNPTPAIARSTTCRDHGSCQHPHYLICSAQCAYHLLPPHHHTHRQLPPRAHTLLPALRTQGERGAGAPAGEGPTEPPTTSTAEPSTTTTAEEAAIEPITGPTVTEPHAHAHDKGAEGAAVGAAQVIDSHMLTFGIIHCIVVL